MASCMTLLLASCSERQAEEKKVEAKKVSVQRINSSSQEVILHYSGVLEPEHTAKIGFAVPGVVDRILVEEGQHVNKGQLLATIDATEYVNALAIADAGLEQAEDMYERLDGLYQKGSLPEKDFIDIKTKLAQARANKSINAKRIADSKLTAPISGTISGKMIEQGSTAAPGVPAFSIVKTDHIYAKLSVPESEIGKVKRGTEVNVYIPTLNDTLTGKVSIINPQADGVSKTFPIKVLISNSTGQLLPGMIADARINTGLKTEGITIPAKAVVRDADDLTYVFVLGQENKVIRKRISLGNATGQNEILVKDGLQEGDQLVVAGQTSLKDGATVSY